MRESQRGKKKKETKVIPPPPSRTQAEYDYGTGARNMPPMLHEMSTESRIVAESGFSNSLSNLKTNEQAARNKGNKGALTQGSIDRLTDTEVTVDSAAHNLAGHWDTMMGAKDRPNPAWYFGHNRRLGQVADKYGYDINTAIDASGSMSPQNDPDSEYKAVSAMMDAHRNKRQIRATNDIWTHPSEDEAKKGVEPRLVMKAGERRRLSSMSPEDMQHATSTANAGNVSYAKGFNLPGFRNSGTNRKQGFGTLADDDYNAVNDMKAAKVHLYTSAIREAKPDTPLHHEYEMRFGDQTAARDVREKRERDTRFGMTGSTTLRGVPDRVDIYGLMKGGDDPTDRMYNHPVLGTRGLAVPDTWMNALLSGQELTDEPGAPSPAKMAGSKTRATSAGIGPEHSGGIHHTFMGKTEAKREGGKEWTGNAAQGMASLAAMQQAATYGREAESQTNIPPVMMQEMTWVHGRQRVADSVKAMIGKKGVGKGKAMTRIAKLTGGSLAGEKEFRPPEDTGPSNVTRLETPGMFNRGYDNPLTRDEGITVVPASGGHAAPTSGGTRRSNRDIAQTNFAAPAPTEGPGDLAKRRAIRGAQAEYKASRADGGAAWHTPKPKRTLSEGF